MEKAGKNIYFIEKEAAKKKTFHKGTRAVPFFQGCPVFGWKRQEPSIEALPTCFLSLLCIFCIIFCTSIFWAIYPNYGAIYFGNHVYNSKKCRHLWRLSVFTRSWAPTTAWKEKTASAWLVVYDAWASYSDQNAGWSPQMVVFVSESTKQNSLNSGFRNYCNLLRWCPAFHELS